MEWVEVSDFDNDFSSKGNLTEFKDVLSQKVTKWKAWRSESFGSILGTMCQLKQQGMGKICYRDWDYTHCQHISNNRAQATMVGK